MKNSDDQNPVTLDYETPNPTNSTHGWVTRFLTVSNVILLISSLIFFLDVIDFNWYMVAALALFVSAPFWITGAACILVMLLREHLNRGKLVPISIAAHLLWAGCVFFVITHYYH